MKHLHVNVMKIGMIYIAIKHNMNVINKDVKDWVNVIKMEHVIVIMDL